MTRPYTKELIRLAGVARHQMREVFYGECNRATLSTPLGEEPKATVSIIKVRSDGRAGVRLNYGDRGIFLSQCTLEFASPAALVAHLENLSGVKWVEKHYEDE